VFDADELGPVFSRDCCEYHFDTPLGSRLVLCVNHFKSKGYSSPGDPIGAKRRRRQAVRVAEIVTSLREEGIVYVAVVGDLNDHPASDPLQPLLAGAGLTDVSEYDDFDWNHRRGTYGSGNEKDKIDYVLLSEPLYDRVVGGGVFRKGVWRGPRTKDPWDVFPTMDSETDQASDHAAVYADLVDV
jgi:endonuclease/exonuclease/phosphatase family metal-dependent hydrolase